MGLLYHLSFIKCFIETGGFYIHHLLFESSRYYCHFKAEETEAEKGEILANFFYTGRKDSSHPDFPLKVQDQFCYSVAWWISNRVKLYYFHSPYLRIRLLTTISLSAQINTCGPFAVIHGHEQSGERFDLPNTDIPSWGQTRPLCLLASLLIL